MSLIKLGDIQFAYDDTGVGLPVVLLHGYPFNRSLWNEQVSALRNSFRRTFSATGKVKRRRVRPR
jgi:pimeloyl-ACP methyl ester carboxylesterase